MILLFTRLALFASQSSTLTWLRPLKLLRLLFGTYVVFFDRDQFSSIFFFFLVDLIYCFAF